MTITYRMNKKTGKLYVARRSIASVPVHIIGDVPAYRSMITGEMIEGRKAHREHLARHGMQEVGNEGHPSTYKPEDHMNTEAYRKQLRDDIKRARSDIEYDRQPTLERLRQEAPRALREMGLD